MVFSAPLFLYLFLPFTVIAYFSLPGGARNGFLLLMSIVFYGWGAPRVLGLLIASCLIDYIIAHYLDRTQKLRVRRGLLLLSLFINVGALVYYKYTHFLLHEVNRVLIGFDIRPLSFGAIVLPIGISFFTFHKISYIVDIYRRTVAPTKNLIDYGLYILFFPQLIAGPIIRYHDIERFLARRSQSSRECFEGFCRFSIGLGKKVIIADTLGSAADVIFGMNPSQLSFSWAWMGAIVYAFQIYFDFSGYSDMAIGLARIFGFTFLENFDRPYISASMTEFWRRWHISLSRWMRDYLYIPLGGNRVGVIRQYINLWIVFLVSGFWHGASWHYVVWGVYHGVFLVLDRLWFLSFAERIGRLASTVITFVLILFSWVLFRADNLPASLLYLGRMINPFSWWSAPQQVPYGLVLTPFANWILLIAAGSCFLPAFPLFDEVRGSIRSSISERYVDTLRFIGVVLLLILSALSMAVSSYSPFIYFQF